MKYPNFEKANQQRTALAAARTAAEAWAAIDLIDCHEPTGERDRCSAFRYRDALKARHDNKCAWSCRGWRRSPRARPRGGDAA